ncbi:MAG: N-formylglutamate amidohydrolase, partial [Sphingomonadales bacterium]
MAELFQLSDGEGPLLITVPHAGMAIPDDLRENYTEAGLSGMDADVFVNELYSFTKAHGYSNLISNISRYVVDLNRSPRDENLYPGQFSTGLVPTVSFDERLLYLEGKEPGMIERIGRIKTYFFPYHQEIEKTLQAKKEKHGRALLWDAHSIKSHVPSLFEGKLPDFNFGTFDGKSCELPVEEAFSKVMKEFPEYSFVFNGRFKGG